MNIQEIIVYIVLAITVGIVIRHVYRKFTGKTKVCDCGSCPMKESACHGHDNGCKSCH